MTRWSDRSASSPRCRRPPAVALAIDAFAYLRSPRATARRAVEGRRLGDAIGVTLVGVLLTAVPPTLVPATKDPPRIPRVYAVGLSWLGAHRATFAMAAALGLAAVSLLGYLLTAAAVRLLRPRGTTIDWRGILAGLGRINALSVLSAVLPLPGVVMQIAAVPGYIPVDVVLIPPAVALGGWVAVPAWWTLRDGAQLGAWRAAAALLVPAAAAVAAGIGAVVLAFQVTWGEA